MRDAQPQAIHLQDYRAPDYWLDATELEFDLHDDHTRVNSRLSFRRNSAAAADAPLLLNGQGLELLSIHLNGKLLDAQDYQLGDESLTIAGVSAEFVLEVSVRIDPAANTALEGLYRSGGMYCTQCEAEGFRRITYYPDRPDVMSVFTTHIIADAGRYPVLLSNGNKVADTNEGGRRRVTWHDPH